MPYKDKNKYKAYQRQYRINRRKKEEAGVLVYLPAKTYNKIKRLASKKGLSLNDTYTELIEGGLNEA